MTEAAGLNVAVVVRKVRVRLSAVVVRQLEQALTLTTRHILLETVAKEVQREVGALKRVDKVHTKHVLVEVQRGLGVLDAEHRAGKLRLPTDSDGS